MRKPFDLAELEKYTVAKDFSAAVHYLEQSMRSSAPDQRWQLASRLASLFYYDLRDLDRSMQYVEIAIRLMIDSEKIAPAITLYKWAKSIAPQDVRITNIQNWLIQAFSKGHRKPKAADEGHAIPTPYQEFKATVTFDEQDISWARAQWHEIRPKRVTLFSELSAVEFIELTQISEVVQASAGQVIFQEGDTADAFYIVSKGQLEATAKSGLRRFFKEGDFFGELALMGRMRRTATVRAIDEAVLLKFSQKVLDHAFRSLPSLRKRVHEFYEQRLFLYSASRSMIFQGLSLTDLEEVWERFLPIHVPAGRVILKEGSKGDQVYLLLQGFCEIVKQGERVGRLGPGQFLGEISMIRRTPRTADAVALTDCQMAECDFENFEKLCERFQSLKTRIHELAEARDPEFEITGPISLD